ncbi:ABC transporter permease [Phenylobacterium sp.]|jgi:ABC-type Na+ efflux pump permease subunit|uniref:ABC transporter permease n=1 Tax=Phenylobacterium sp. TaxID=1871053 RepID=UPI002F3F1F95
MNAKLLVALREFRQIISTRSFWLTMLLMPAAILISQISTRLIQPPPGIAVVVVDATGRYQAAIQQRFTFDRDQEALSDLGEYAQKWKIPPQSLRSEGAGDVWADGPRLFTPADVAAFEAAGGLKAAQAELARLKPAGAPDFKPPKPGVIPVPPPAGLVTDKGPDAFGQSLAPQLKRDVPTPVGPRKIGLGVYIPADYGAPKVAARFFTDGTPRPMLVDSVRQELTAIQRADALKASGIDPAALARIQAVRAPITFRAPPEGGSRERVILHSALPLALAYLLLLAIMMSGSWMLQGLIEERSNRLLESVLACVTPDDLLFGKLIGVLGVGLVMVGAWMIFAIGVAFSMQGAIADFLRPALESVSSPGVIAALLYYFLAGYLAISILFLAVGAVSDSMRDAQAYLTPLILLITIPFVIIAQSVLLNPDGPLPRILSWVPIYAPFAMMARLGGGVPTWEIVGSGVLLAAFIGVEMVFISRLFRSSLLQSGQTGGLKALLRRARA